MVTDRQIRMLRHALGLDNSKVPYRNYYATNKGADTYQDCKALVEIGLMEFFRSDSDSSFDVYTVTEEGRKLAIDMGAASDIQDTEAYKDTVEKILTLCEAAPEITEETKLSELGDGRVNAVSDTLDEIASLCVLALHGGEESHAEQ